MSEPRLYVVSAPSGGGKTSLIRALLEGDSNIRLSVSCTTRAPRPGEVDGVDYHFVDKDTFRDMIARNEFLEYARVFDYCYGTGRQAVEQQLEAGYDVILDIDWQGARQIRKSFPACRTIFILPPSLEELHRRLAGRGQDSPETIERRMRDARTEISHWQEFDFVIVNDDFDAALADLRAIIRKGKPRRHLGEEKMGELLAHLLESR